MERLEILTTYHQTREYPDWKYRYTFLKIAKPRSRSSVKEEVRWRDTSQGRPKLIWTGCMTLQARWGTSTLVNNEPTFWQKRHWPKIHIHATPWWSHLRWIFSPVCPKRMGEYFADQVSANFKAIRVMISKKKVEQNPEEIDLALTPSFPKALGDRLQEVQHSKLPLLIRKTWQEADEANIGIFSTERFAASGKPCIEILTQVARILQPKNDEQKQFSLHAVNNMRVQFGRLPNHVS